MFLYYIIETSVTYNKINLKHLKLNINRINVSYLHVVWLKWYAPANVALLVLIIYKRKIN